MIKITIKTIYGSILFEYEKANNTLRDTVIQAVKTGASLTGAYLRGAYLTGADLRGADLRGADLTGADLTGADLRGAYLTGADLTGAYLTGAYLRGADLTGAYLRGADGNKVKIKRAAIFTGLYKYLVIPFISDDNVKYVRMGCYIRTVEDWDKDFWNNENEFPNNGSEKSNLRLFAYETAKKWLEIVENN